MQTENNISKSVKLFEKKHQRLPSKESPTIIIYNDNLVNAESHFYWVISTGDVPLKNPLVPIHIIHVEDFNTELVFRAY